MSGKSMRKGSQNPKRSAKKDKTEIKDPGYDEVHTVEEPKKVRLSFQLIVQRNLPPEAGGWSHEEIVEQLSTVSHVRLDRENIRLIDNLELMSSKVTNLYLQHNCIEKIENLECLTNLRFLALSCNKIRKVEGLTSLKHLGFLDLSQNLIQTFDIDEFPQSLIILNLTDNPCTHMSDYRGSIIQDLHNLKQLDEKEVTKLEKKEVGFTVSSDSEEEEEEESDEEQEYKMPDVKMDGPITRQSVQDIIGSASSNILLRSQKRLETYHIEHQQKMNMLEEYREECDLPPSTARTARSNKSVKVTKTLKTKSERSRRRPANIDASDSD